MICTKNLKSTLQGKIFPKKKLNLVYCIQKGLNFKVLLTRSWHKFCWNKYNYECVHVYKWRTYICGNRSQIFSKILSDENLSRSTRQLKVTKWYIRKKREWYQLNMLLAILNRFPNLTKISRNIFENFALNVIDKRILLIVIYFVSFTVICLVEL